MGKRDGSQEAIGTEESEPRPLLEQKERSYTTAELFGGLREIVIAHEGGDYRLRITASGKLILTK
jgi:hemin uptake protein HemP